MRWLLPQQLYLAWPSPHVMAVRPTLWAYLYSGALVVLGLGVGSLLFWMILERGFGWWSAVLLVLATAFFLFGLVMAWKTATECYRFDLQENTFVYGPLTRRQTVPLARIRRVYVGKSGQSHTRMDGGTVRTVVHISYVLTVELAPTQPDLPARPRRRLSELCKSEPVTNVVIGLPSDEPARLTALAEEISEVLRYCVTPKAPAEGQAATKDNGGPADPNPAS